MSSKLKKQVASLTAQVAQMKVTSQPQGKGKKAKRRNKKKKPASINTGGVMRIKRTELAQELILKPNTTGTSVYIPLVPMKDKSLSWLAKLSANFTQIVWHSCKIEYRPAVGINKDGSLTLGVEWNPGGNSTPTKAQVQCLTPNFQVPVWQKKELTVPPSRLQSRKYYVFSGETSNSDSSPGDVLAYLSGSKPTADVYYGDIWITYDVTLMGPK